jgi:hypothetical protein
MATGAPDPQQELVYRWEDGFRCFGERTMTRAQVVRLVRRLARKWRLPVPPVGFMPKAKREWSYLQRGRIVMNYGQCNEGIVCHEMAHHAITCEYDEGDVEDHGPEFFAIYLDMLEFTKVAPRIALEASAFKAGIVWRIA